jgi:hypothetical protein
MALSPTRKARAICLTDRPETMRSASAICCVAGRSGWQQTQDVVAVVGIVEPCGNLLLGVVEVRQHLFVGQWLVAGIATHGVDRGIAPDEDQPGNRIARRSLLRPGFQRPQASVLERFLGGIEVAEVAQQGGHRAGTGGGQRLVDPLHVGHAGSVQGWKMPTGRIS